jgi:hypothetical protein
LAGIEGGEEEGDEGAGAGTGSGQSSSICTDAIDALTVVDSTTGGVGEVVSVGTVDFESSWPEQPTRRAATKTRKCFVLRMVFLR